ncbi:MAG: hypothetical protein WC728_07815 [Elusimicrobiota bacterium]
MSAICSVLLTALTVSPALAYMAIEPESSNVREVTTAKELNENLKDSPDLLKKINQQLKEAEALERSGQAEAWIRGELDKKEPPRQEEKPPEVQPMPKGPDRHALGEASSRQQDGPRSAMSQLKGAAKGEAAGAPPVGSSGQVDTGSASSGGAPGGEGSDKSGSKSDEQKTRQMIEKIVKEKCQDEKIKELYKDYLTRVADNKKAGGSPYLEKHFPAIRKGIKDGGKNFPKAKYGDVGGAMATWQGNPNGGGDGLITMKPGLKSMEVFHHEFIHHGDAGNFDGSPIGENYKNGAEPLAYADMKILP